MFSAFDHQMMQRALALAERGRFTTQPNPRVGCVITVGEHVVGEAWHRKSGEPHAEPLALQAAGEQARGGTAYVTLEPHCHQSRTPPCTQALIRAGIRRVVCATLDPNPQVHAEGARELREAGLQVDVGLLETQASALNAGFAKRMRTGLPRVIVKVAASLDGRVALANGESQWITGPAARADVQRLRAEMGAILTGIDTVLADDPQLNVRDPAIDTLGRQPLRVVLDSRLRMPPTARILQQPGETLVFTLSDDVRAAKTLEQKGAKIVVLPRGTGERVDLTQVVQALGAAQCNDVLVEAGPTLGARFVELRLADELIVYIAPMLLGPQARAMFELPPLERLADRLQFQLHRSETVGDDLKLVLRPQARITDAST
ncbi:MAG TPA: bifunctional diaminohydroxyphosphoribosylaminopyrimidine deaminase/5-amino-6-(5-phosphoribosylamino)uracil reductase RibD [Povalibacter sp.]